MSLKHPELFDMLEFARRILAEESWVPTPLLPATIIGDHLGVDLWLKREDCTPIGSFKLRGALVAMSQMVGNLPAAGVWVASAGNYGLGIAVAGQRYNVRVTVVVPERATPSKVDRIRIAGATVICHGRDFDTAKAFARESAEREGAVFWEDGVIQETSLGAATIGIELLQDPVCWDVVVVPLGNGSLIKGIATVFKNRSPQTQVVGVAPADAPSMAQALRGECWDETVSIDTYADGLAVRVPIRSMVEDLKKLVDDIWLVEEEKLLPSVRSLIEMEQVLTEPSAAIVIAGIVDRQDHIRGKRVSAILTGAHLDASLLPKVIGVEGVM